MTARRDRGDMWAAFNTDGGLLVMTVDKVPFSFEAIKVIELVHGQDGQTPLRVAVLDDVADTAASLADMLADEDAPARPIRHRARCWPAGGLATVHCRFVLDWWLGKDGRKPSLLNCAASPGKARTSFAAGHDGRRGKGRQQRRRAGAEALPLLRLPETDHSRRSDGEPDAGRVRPASSDLMRMGLSTTVEGERIGGGP